VSSGIVVICPFSPEDEMSASRIFTTGLAAFVLSGAVALWSVPADAGASTGRWRNGMVDGPYGPGYYGPDGTFYGDGRPRPRRYVREYHRPSRNYREYYQYDDAYERPRSYRWRQQYEYRRRPYWDEDSNW